MKRREEEKRLAEEADENSARACKIGDRCETQVPNQPKRRGTVMYVGKYVVI